MVSILSAGKLQKMKEQINDNLKAEKRVKKKEGLLQLRGEGSPGNADMLYGSIYSAEADKETIIGLQQKYIYMTEVLQSADAAPTEAVKEGIAQLNRSLETIQQIFGKM